MNESDLVRILDDLENPDISVSREVKEISKKTAQVLGFLSRNCVMKGEDVFIVKNKDLKGKDEANE